MWRWNGKICPVCCHGSIEHHYDDMFLFTQLCYMRSCTSVSQLSYLEACSSNNGQTCSGNGVSLTFLFCFCALSICLQPSIHPSLIPRPLPLLHFRLWSYVRKNLRMGLGHSPLPMQPMCASWPARNGLVSQISWAVRSITWEGPMRLWDHYN